eukprot:Opistho-2@20037
MEFSMATSNARLTRTRRGIWPSLRYARMDGWICRSMASASPYLRTTSMDTALQGTPCASHFCARQRPRMNRRTWARTFLNTPYFRIARTLSSPIDVVAVGAHCGGTDTHSLFSCDAATVVLDAVKLAEDTHDVILRLYEGSGATVPCVNISSRNRIVRVTRVTILEDALALTPTDTDGKKSRSGACVTLDDATSSIRLTNLRPFELVSLAIEMSE